MCIKLLLFICIYSHGQVVGLICYTFTREIFGLAIFYIRVGRFNPPARLNSGLTRIGLNPHFRLNWVKPGLSSFLGIMH